MSMKWSETECTVCHLHGMKTDGLADYVIYVCPGCNYLHVLHVRCAPEWMREDVLAMHRTSIVMRRVN